MSSKVSVLNVNIGYTDDYGARIEKSTSMTITPKGKKIELLFENIPPIRERSVKIIIENGGLMYDRKDTGIMNLRFHFAKNSKEVLITAKYLKRQRIVDIECKIERKKLENLAATIGDYTLTIMKSTRN